MTRAWSRPNPGSDPGRLSPREGVSNVTTEINGGTVRYDPSTGALTVIVDGPDRTAAIQVHIDNEDGVGRFFAEYGESV